MSVVIDTVADRILENSYSLEKIVKDKENIDFIIYFLEKIGITNDEMAVKKPDQFFSFISDTTPVKPAEIQTIIKNYELDMSDLSRRNYDNILARRRDNMLSVVDPVFEDIIYLKVLDNAANKMVGLYKKYIDFLNDMDEDLLKLIPSYESYLSHVDVNHRKFLLLVLRLSWEMEYLSKAAEIIELTRAAENKTEIAYKENIRKKVLSKLMDDGVYTKWKEEDRLALDYFGASEMGNSLYVIMKGLNDVRTSEFKRLFVK